MQLWVSKLNKNKWKIALIILSVALVTSCVFGVTTAWFNTVTSSHVKVNMDLQYVDIFVDNNNNNAAYNMVPGQTITGIPTPKVEVNEREGTFCVFVQVSEIGGTAGHTYLQYATVSGWTKLTETQVNAFNFPQREDTSYFYQVVDASQVDTLAVLQESVTVTANTTYQQIREAWDTASPVKLQVVAAGCKTKQNGLATVAEADFAEVYTAFIG